MADETPTGAPHTSTLTPPTPAGAAGSGGMGAGASSPTVTHVHTHDHDHEHADSTKDKGDKDMAEGKDRGFGWAIAATSVITGGILLGAGVVAVNSINNNRRFDQMNYNMAQNAANQGFIMANTNVIRDQNVASALTAQHNYYRPLTAGHYLHNYWDGYGHGGQGNGARYGTVGANSPVTSTNNRSADGSLFQP